jgi:4-amino-4-deoxy-L-arabinose transferase-like glycosyltransferase
MNWNWTGNWHWIPFAIIVLIGALNFIAAGIFAIFLDKKTPVRNSGKTKTAAPQTLQEDKTPRLIRADFIALAAICVVYGIFAFVNIGSRDTPQSFAEFTENSVALFTLDEPAAVKKIEYYAGVGVGGYTVTFFGNGSPTETYLEQTHNHVFKWTSIEAPAEQTQSTAYQIRITGTRDGSWYPQLGMIRMYDENGKRVLLRAENDLAALLIDEPAISPHLDDYRYNAYFDEIYHPRTAMEYLQQLWPYEITHPPLGKAFISLGMRMFGVNPFGWRFIGVLFGILMLIPIYLFIHELYGKTLVSAAATIIFAFDFMHYVQTRIATIDTYAVFFIILMYWFLYKWWKLPKETPFAKTLPPLFLSGLSFGLGVASKWTVIYGAVGLIVIYIWKLVRDRKDIGRTVAVSIPAFIIIPVFIYIFSYLPYEVGKWHGEAHTFGDYLRMIWENQTSMFFYHSGLEATHPYSSTWWSWLVDLRPILYFNKYYPDHTRVVFGAFTNPLVCWAGLGALITCLVAGIVKKDRRGLIIAIGYMSQLFPWIWAGSKRVIFAYHYFPDVVFLVLAIAYVFNAILERDKPAKVNRRIVYIFTGGCVAMFLIFLPALMGIRVPDWYTTWLAWFNGNYPF